MTRHAVFSLFLLTLPFLKCSGFLYHVHVGVKTRDIQQLRSPFPRVESSNGAKLSVLHGVGRVTRIRMDSQADDAAETPADDDSREELADEKKQTFRQKLRKMGLAVLLSYGWVSNMSYAIIMSVAWYGFTKKTGLSPLAPDQWKPFLAVYGGLYIFNNVIRPLRLALSVAIARYFENAVAFIERKTKVSKSVAIVIMVFLANVVGTLGAFALGISLASTATGVPIWPPKA